MKKAAHTEILSTPTPLTSPRDRRQPNDIESMPSINDNAIKVTVTHSVHTEDIPLRDA
jgi:hypothetical protein